MFKKENYKLATLFNVTLFIWILFIPMKTSFYQISYALMIVIFLLHVFTKKRIHEFKEMLYEYKHLLVAFSLIILSMSISNMLSPLATFLSWETEFHYIFRYLLLFLVLIFLYKESFFSKKFLLVAVLCSLFLQGIDGVFQAIFHFDFIKGYESNLTQGLTAATFHRNVFGMFMALGSSVSLGLLFYQQKFALKKSDIFILCMLFILFSFNLMFSYSRASWVFFAVFTFILYSFNYKKLNKNHFLILLSFLSIAIIIVLINKTLLTRVDSLIEGNSSYRFEIWSYTIALIKQKILFGHGLMTFSQTIGQIKIGGFYHSGVHNSILEILLFLGLFGFIMYTNLLWKILKKIISNKNIIQVALFFAFLAITQFDQSIIKGIVSLSSLTIFAFFIFSHAKSE